jgi:hypothetical protein
MPGARPWSFCAIRSGWRLPSPAFQNDIPANEPGQRIREIGGYYFVRSMELYSLVITAFQGAVDEKLAHEENLEQAKRRLLIRLAALKKELGLTDLYQIEGWRQGRD